ncbi:MAG TPA: calcium-binding protein [Actinomycetota bacterium]|jgi:Ca2+-binding RTX toxin-like protein
MRRLALLTSLTLAFGLLVVDPSGAQSPHDCWGLQATIIGTEGDDVLEGTPQRDVIVGLGGDDEITGRGRRDYICGDRGGDVLRGNANADELLGGRGDDRLVAGITYTQKPCDDASSCLDLFDQLFGGAGDDVLYGSNGRDEMFGNKGADVLRARGGGDYLLPAGGDDVVLGGRGGAGVSYGDAPRGVRVDLAARRATGWGNDVLKKVRGVSGSLFADVLIGDRNDNFLGGSDSFDEKNNDGHDVLRGKGGDDDLYGLGGADDIYGGAGDDRLNGDRQENYSGPDKLYGGPGRDRCFYGERYEGCERKRDEPMVATRSAPWR